MDSSFNLVEGFLPRLDGFFKVFCGRFQTELFRKLVIKVFPYFLRRIQCHVERSDCTTIEPYGNFFECLLK